MDMGIWAWTAGCPYVQIFVVDIGRKNTIRPSATLPAGSRLPAVEMDVVVV